MAFPGRAWEREKRENEKNQGLIWIPAYAEMTRSNKMEFAQLYDAKEEAKKAAETMRERHPELLETPSKPTGWKLAALKLKLSGGCNFLKNLILANPDEFYGKHYATDELVEHSRLTARVVSIGSLLNAITNQPILFFAFKDFGNGVAIISSLIRTLLRRFLAQYQATGQCESLS